MNNLSQKRLAIAGIVDLTVHSRTKMPIDKASTTVIEYWMCSNNNDHAHIVLLTSTRARAEASSRFAVSLLIVRSLWHSLCRSCAMTVSLDTLKVDAMALDAEAVEAAAMR